MATKKWALFAALLLCLAACSDPETATPEPQGPNPTPNTVYEPIDLLIISESQQVEALGHETDSKFVWHYYNPLTNWWDLYSHFIIYFPEDEICKDLGGTIYYQLITEVPNLLYVHFEFENNGWGKIDELGRNLCYNEFYDYLYSLDSILCTPTYGSYKFKIVLYQLETKRYFITDEHEFVLLEDKTCYINKL